MDPVGQVDLRRMNATQWLVVIVIDVLVLAELAVAMYVAAGHPDTFTLTFMKTFFGMLIPTLVLGFLAKRMMRSASLRIKS
ncbi:MAG TPA: hypothetical protein VMU60_05020 [Syntrophobacteria bacterium]|nr:hypothetical protein [Syntrophobacteria bacterium]